MQIKIKVSARSLPSGLKEILLVWYEQSDTGKFYGKPKTGIEVTYADWLTDKSPLVKDDIIVAVNGYAVNTLDQFYVARNLTTKPSAWVIYWNGKEYQGSFTSRL